MGTAVGTSRTQCWTPPSAGGPGASPSPPPTEQLAQVWGQALGGHLGTAVMCHLGHFSCASGRARRAYMDLKDLFALQGEK